MKKIFAIALALVMVFSMASAFAFNNCSSTNFEWPCDADVNFCGKGKVEVVPYVKANVACGGFEYQANSCVGAVASEDIYWAVKLTVFANPDHSSNYDPAPTSNWWDAAVLTVEASDEVDFVTETFDAFETEAVIDWDADEDEVYYYFEGAFVHEDDVDDIADVMYVATVLEDAQVEDVEVCATLESYSDGVGTWYFGDYTVIVDVDTLVVEKDDEFFAYVVADEGEQVTASSAAFAAEVNSFFKLNGCTLGTCLTASNVEKNFGWDDEFEFCAPWSAKAAAIVDAECVVAIPKTGSVSVVAYAVMAVVAAAGMLKK